MIHPTAMVSPEARLGEGVAVGACAIIEAGVEIGADSIIHPHTIVRSGTVLGARVVVHSFAVLGGPPQDLRFDERTPSGVRVGEATVLREGVTINRSTRAGAQTVIGAHCFLMANAHVAHDCRIGDRVIMANAVLVGGHCEVGDDAFLGGGCAVHQFLRLGEGVMVGGLSPVTLDVPPFTLVADRNRLAGLNLVGLKRRGCPGAAITELKTLFARVYASRHPKVEAARLLSAGGVQSAEARRFLAFFEGSRRGIAHPRRVPVETESEIA